MWIKNLLCQVAAWLPSCCPTASVHGSTFMLALKADYIALTHRVCTQYAWGAFSLCISACERVCVCENRKTFRCRLSKSDLHVNHSPPPDCSYWVKCGGNFVPGRSPSIIKQFFLEFRKIRYPISMTFKSRWTLISFFLWRAIHNVI